MSWQWLLIGLVSALFFLFFFPAPEGCGCAARKRRMQQLGGEIFGA